MKSKFPQSEADLAKRRNTFLKELSKESDRGLVLIAASILEEDLEMLLRSVMRKGPGLEDKVLGPLFRSDGPLGSFAGKTRVAYAMELVDDVSFRDLTTIRSIRNRFAHSYEEASLLDESIRTQIMNLETGKVFEELFKKSPNIYFKFDEEGEQAVAVAEEQRRIIGACISLAAVIEGATRAFEERQKDRYGG